ncbi:hypothetical protein FACS189468_5070 [Spirochaetia bacterium]|nr:hypothetical protein FACS189468_5070 [Spirochaetia bacterium]
MLTNLGKMLRNLCTDNGITQEQLAKDLGVSPAALSLIVNSKAPSMELLAGVIGRFNLKGKDIRELFFRAFSSSFRAGQKIEIDPRFFKKERWDTLAQVIVTLLLHPDYDYENVKISSFITLKDSMSTWYNKLSEYVEFSSLSQKGEVPQKVTHKSDT